MGLQAERAIRCSRGISQEARVWRAHYCLELTGAVNAFGRIFYYAALFLTVMPLTPIGRFTRLQFFLSWWAYSSPWRR